MTAEALRGHREEYHFACKTCSATHASHLVLQQHRTAKHHACVKCDIQHPSLLDLRQHNEDHHFGCKTCHSIHASHEELQEHRVSQHYLCDKCDIQHASSPDLRQHRANYHLMCSLCDLTHESQVALDEHRVNIHYWCIPCGRSFQNQNNLKQHQNSSQHTEMTLSCPMKDCTNSFISLSALIAHAESGGCASGITRREIDRAVVKADPNGIITEHRLIMESPNTSMYPFNNETKYQATQLAWNGRSFECYLCHRGFRQLRDLNAHLGSSVHTSSKIYHCPPRGCGTTFSTLSGLMRHIEDESCGVRRFRFVERAIQDNVSQFSQLRSIENSHDLVHPGATKSVVTSFRFCPY